MEFLSEDLYGGQQVSVSDALNDINQFDINSIQNLQQNLDQLQFLNPGLFQTPASSIDFGMLTSGLPVTAEAVLGQQAVGGLMDTLQTVNDPATQAFYQGLIDGQAVQNQVEQNLAGQRDDFEDPVGDSEAEQPELLTFDALLSSLRELVAAGMLERATQEQVADSQELGQEIQELNNIIEGYNPETDDPNDTIEQINQLLRGSDLRDIGGFDE